MPACLLDSNVWLAAAFAEHPAHAVARGVLRTARQPRSAGWMPTWPPSRLHPAFPYPAYKPHIKIINEEQEHRAAKMDGLIPNYQPS